MNFALLPILLLLEVAFAGPATITTTDPDDIVATMAIGGVELRYRGTAAGRTGAQTKVKLSLANSSDKPIHLLSGIDDRVSFSFAVTTPNGERIRFWSEGVSGERVGNNIAVLKPGQRLEEEVDLGRLMTFDQPGRYLITVRREINGVVTFPQRVLEIVDLQLIIDQSRKR